MLLQAASSWLTLFFFSRLPLERGKKLREILREKGLLHRFLQHHHYDVGTKFPHAFPDVLTVVTEPLLNTLDVSAGFDPWQGSPGVVCGTLIPVTVPCMDQILKGFSQKLMSFTSSHPAAVLQAECSHACTEGCEPGADPWPIYALKASLDPVP